MEPFETFEHAGFTVGLYADVDPPTPADWDTLGTMHSFETRDQLQGWEDGAAAYGAWERERPGLTVRYLRAEGELAVLFQYQDYGSSGARVVVLDDDEDARATGYISTTAARVRELCGDPAPGEAFYKAPGWQGTAEDWVRKALAGEVGTWNAMLEGRVVGYVVSDPAAGDPFGAGHVDSCWGFYPDEEGDGLEYVRSEARAAAEGERDERARRLVETVRGWGMAHGLAVA